MTSLWIYLVGLVGAVIWVTLDKNASGTFEIFSANLHQCARAMGMYWEWVRYSFGRLVFLSFLVILSLGSTGHVFQNNPIDLEESSKWLLLAVMLTGTLLVIASPPLADRLRFIKLIYVKVRHFSDVGLADLSSDSAPLEPADYATESSWSAWHPILEDYEQDPVWRDMAPVLYLCKSAQTSLVVTIDFEYFLACNWPGEVHAKEPLPFTGPGDTRFIVESIRQLPCRPGWTIIHAEMEEFEGVPIAA